MATTVQASGARFRSFTLLAGVSPLILVIALGDIAVVPTPDLASGVIAATTVFARRVAHTS